MKARWIIVGVALAALIVLSVGYAVAGSSQQGTCRQQMAQDHAASMQRIHSQMPAAQAGCDQLHTQMGGTTMGPNGMMGGDHMRMMGG